METTLAGPPMLRDLALAGAASPPMLRALALAGAPSGGAGRSKN